jgi:hypothetical protein
MLTKQELLLAAEMLQLASDQFSNHGCNDLPKSALSLVSNEENLCARVRAWNGDAESDWPKRAESIGDSSLMQYLSDQLRNWGETI